METVNRSQGQKKRVGNPVFEPSMLCSRDPLSDIIHRVSHEIGNPLTAIISLATIIERYTEGANDGDLASCRNKLLSYAGSIIEEGWRVNLISQRLVLLFSHKSGSSLSCDLQTAVIRTVNKLKNHKKYKIFDVQINILPSTSVYVDSPQFEALLNEVFENAYQSLHYNVQQGVPDPVLCQTIEVSARREGNFTELTVSNIRTRPCPFELTTLFEPFVTEYAEKRHLGLGLTVALAIATRFGGSLRVEEESNGDEYRFSTLITLPSS